MQWRLTVKSRARCLALAVLFAADGAHAVCVSNSADLAAALVAAQFAPITIKLVQGNYDLHDSPWHVGAVAQGGTALLGGYTAGCAARDIALGNTGLNDLAANAYFDIVYPTGDLTIEGVTWYKRLYILADTNTLKGSELPPGTKITVRRSAFYYGGLEVDWGQDDAVGGTIRIVNNVLSTTGGASSCNLSVDVSDGGSPDTQVINNTLVDTTTVGACFINGDNGGAAFRLYNNIFWNNSLVDVSTDSVALIAVDNVIGSFDHPTLLIPQVGTYGGDPKLDGSFRPIEAPVSPVINTGTANNVPGGLPATDLGGRARIIGSAPDRGAYESLIDDSTILDVTNANDHGPGSLRAALDSANGDTGFHIVTFSIGSDCGPHVITLQSALPAITANVLINGYSQPGSSQNDLDVGDDATICIVLDGNNVTGYGLRVPSTAANQQLIVKGIAFSGFTGAAIALRGGNGPVVEGVRIGGNASGVALDSSLTGIVVSDNALFATIGGSEPRQRNIIGAATQDGIDIEPATIAHGTQIINNYIGVGWSTASGAFTNRGNGRYGIDVNGREATIADNVVGFSVGDGILLTSLTGGDVHDNIVSGNYIGITPLAGNSHNGGNGIHFYGAAQDDPHDNTIEDNFIADNLATGIAVERGVRNRLRGNAIHDNAFGIDLGGDGTTGNDNDSTSSVTANRGQNFPTLASAIGGHSSGTVATTLTTTPGDYRVEYFASAACDSSGHGQGTLVVGHRNVTIPNSGLVNGQGTINFTGNIASFFLRVPGEVITATATDSLGNTSEFSTCLPYVDDTIFANGFQQGLLGPN